ALRRHVLFAQAHELVAQLKSRIVLAGAADADGADVLALVTNRDDQRAGFFDDFRFAGRLVEGANAGDHLEATGKRFGACPRLLRLALIEQHTQVRLVLSIHFLDRAIQGLLHRSFRELNVALLELLDVARDRWADDADDADLEIGPFGRFDFPRGLLLRK